MESCAPCNCALCPYNSWHKFCNHCCSLNLLCPSLSRIYCYCLYTPKHNHTHIHTITEETWLGTEIWAEEETTFWASIKALESSHLWPQGWKFLSSIDTLFLNWLVQEIYYLTNETNIYSVWKFDILSNSAFQWEIGKSGKVGKGIECWIYWNLLRNACVPNSPDK